MKCAKCHKVYSKQLFYRQYKNGLCVFCFSFTLKHNLAILNPYQTTICVIDNEIYLDACTNWIYHIGTFMILYRVSEKPTSNNDPFIDSILNELPYDIFCVIIDMLRNHTKQYCDCSVVPLKKLLVEGERICNIKLEYK